MNKPSGKYSTTEKAFGSQVEALLDLYSWRWCHSRPAMTKDGWRTALSGHRGFPDYVAVKDKTLFFELKSDKGKLSPDQQLWHDCLKAAGAEVFVWRPSQLEEIAQLLSNG